MTFTLFFLFFGDALYRISHKSTSLANFTLFLRGMATVSEEKSDESDEDDDDAESAELATFVVAVVPFVVGSGMG